MATVCAVRDATQFVQDLLMAVGVPEGSARTTADHLILADVRGVMTHGLIRLPLYVARIQRRDCAVDVTPEVVADRGGVLMVDGYHGLGQVTGDFAMRCAVDRAIELGVGVVSVRRSSHFGAAGGYVLRATERGLIGLAITNTAPLMAPTGGAARRIGNNPLAIGVPSSTGPPILLDIAFSAVAAWTIRMAAEQGRPIPEGWGLDGGGQPTTDASEVVSGEGLLRPVGDHKGYGLALMVDILAGILSGGGFGDQVGRLDQEGPIDASHMFLALDIGHFLDPAEFGVRLASLTAQVRDTPVAAGVDRVLLPGQREAELQAERLREGIPYPDDVYLPLVRLAEELGVPMPVWGGGGQP